MDRSWLCQCDWLVFGSDTDGDGGCAAGSYKEGGLMSVEAKSTQRMMTVMMYAMLAVFALVTLLPFFYLLCSAFKTKEAFFSSHFLPRGEGLLGIDWGGLTLEHFRVLFTDQFIMKNGIKWIVII